MLKANFIKRFLTGGYAHFYIHRLYAESMKGGMLMKSKHVVTYGKEIAFCSFDDYRYIDNFHHKSTITASGKTVIV